MNEYDLLVCLETIDEKGWQHEAFVPLGQVPFLFLDAVSVNRLQRLMTVTYLCLSACG